jgi:ParB-like chromosome segregation protein Spo0J
MTTTALELKIVYRPIASLMANTRNARTHSTQQIKQIAASIRAFDFPNPVLIDQNKMIIAGHGRVAAAMLLGIETIPSIQLEHLNEGQIRAYIIADNKLAERAGWDKAILAIELQHLMFRCSGRRQP